MTLPIGSASWQCRRLFLFLLVISSLLVAVDSFTPLPLFPRTYAAASAPFNTCLRDANKRYEKEIDEKGRRAAETQARPGETVAGAVLGGLLLGPFGALFGASVGAGWGRQAAERKARTQEMERLGLSPEMMQSAREIGEALQRNMEGLQAVQESYETQKRFAQRLDAEAQDLYERAKQALGDSEEELARSLLLERTKVQDKLKQVLKTCAQARQQVQTMESNTAILKNRATEMDALLRRTVGAKAVQDSASLGLSLPSQDPLLDKFKDLGID